MTKRKHGVHANISHLSRAQLPYYYSIHPDPNTPIIFITSIIHNYFPFSLSISILILPSYQIQFVALKVIMSGSSTVEIDFFRLRGEASVISPAPKKLSDRRDIQGVISKINPEILKTAIASASANTSFVANKSCPSPQRTQTQTLPVYSQDCGGVQIARGAAPLTIFYNGSVSVFEVSPDLAESIMRLAESGSSPGSKNAVESTAANSKPGPSPGNQNQAIAGSLNKDLPLSRKKSLRRFLEKRNERQASISPYAYSQGNASSQC
ncbi:hypothetical protein L6452_17083 [Arctium lappa]|uniref:Uncharacterized protein n=1 Tax=Arctium lappa TaxID=4217 RepID=A0ACB9C2A3_ARCLA|nr:hypothetical protein L6452_17083 [Arctium lappa]